MRVIFVAPSTRHPSGGVAVVYEIAAALARRSHDVHLFHVNFLDGTVSTIDEVDWFCFPDGLTHHFVPAGASDGSTVAPADIIFGFSFDAEMPGHTGLPVVLIQGYKMLGDAIERHAYDAPCPKVCVASWLVEVGRELGVPANELVHIPIGIRHDTYRVTLPIAPRPPRVSFCYSTHPQKGAQLAIDVITRVKRAVPDLEVVAFGAAPPQHALPGCVTYVTQPSQRQLVEGIYNTSRVFLCMSRVEGFGLPNVEAMACGVALVTTDNGGSGDYALHDETALVAPYGDVDALSEHVTGLLEDDDRRVAVATAGCELVRRRFNWDRSGELLEAFLERYLAHPAAYGRATRRG
jgi:glycosyltransferase involved in cell wall biosynthesis